MKRTYEHYYITPELHGVVSAGNDTSLNPIIKGKYIALYWPNDEESKYEEIFRFNKTSFVVTRLTVSIPPYIVLQAAELIKNFEMHHSNILSIIEKLAVSS